MKPWTPVVTTDGFDKADSAFDGCYAVEDGLCHFRARLVFGAGVTAGTGLVYVSLPVDAHPAEIGLPAGAAFFSFVEDSAPALSFTPQIVESRAFRLVAGNAAQADAPTYAAAGGLFTLSGSYRVAS